MGLEGGRKKKLTGHSVEGPEAEKEGRRPKRKFELDEEEMLRNAKEERAKARKTLDEEKVATHPIFNRKHFVSRLVLYSPRSQFFLHFGFRLSHHPWLLTQILARLSNFIRSAQPRLPTALTCSLSRPSFL